MGAQDPKFRRESAARRKDDLIRATLSLIADQGLGAATVRAIAEHAEVTQGLIRHYFSTKEDLITAAFERHMSALTAASEAPLLSAADEPPRTRLALFVAAALTPPAIDPGSVALWAGFLSRVRTDERMRATHERAYVDFRNRLEALIAETLQHEGRTPDAPELRRLAIACNAIIDGLWLEGGALPEAFEPDELVRIGVSSVGTIIGVDLSEEVKTA